MQNVNDILLDWYDEHARELPWRVSPVARANGTAPDPYAVWMSEIMLQQTTVAAVKAYLLWMEMSNGLWRVFLRLLILCPRQNGAILLETRPAKGLLGGMQGFPGTVWSENPPDEAPPFEANWNVCTKQVTHVFTHFKLSLTVHVAQVGIEISSPVGTFIKADRFNSGSLPTVMRKVFDLAKSNLNEPAHV